MLASKHRISLKKGEETVYVDPDDISTKWQAEKNGVYTDMAADAEPKYAGKYKLVVSIPAVEDTYDAMSATVDFEITKASLNPTLGYDPVKPGTKVGDIDLDLLRLLLRLYDSYGNEFEYKSDDPSTTDVNENTDSPLAYTVTIKDTFTGKECAADDIINKDSDYVMIITPSFTEKVSAEVVASYEALPVVNEKVRIDTLVETQVNVTLDDKWKESGVISKDYTGSAIALDATDYTAVAQYKNGTDAEGNTVWTDIADAQLTTTWYNSSREVIESEPTDAGTYYVEFSYVGKAGLYADANSQKQKVIITPAKITISSSL